MVEFRSISSLPGFMIGSDGTIIRPNGKACKLDSFAGLGYKVFKGPNRQNFYVHAVVCEAFHGPKRNVKLVARHLNGDRLNNEARNLAWGTDLENSADTVRHGMSTKGEKNARAVLTSNQVDEIRARSKSGAVGAQLAREFNVSKATISLIINNKNWRA